MFCRSSAICSYIYTPQINSIIYTASVNSAIYIAAIDAAALNDGAVVALTDWSGAMTSTQPYLPSSPLLGLSPHPMQSPTKMQKQK